VERRRESRAVIQRLARNELVRIQPLSKGESSFEAVVVDVSSRGMRFMADCAVKPDTALKIEFGGTLLLAEVVHCSRSEEKYILGIRVDQVLSSLSDLLRLQNALLEMQGPRNAPPVPRDHAAPDR
jgi:hypothetical protein